MNDHDLLIELRTEVKGLRSDFKAMADDTKSRIVLLENTKLNKEDFHMHLSEDVSSHNDHEKRIRALEKYFWIALGAVILAQFLAPLIIQYFIK